jgi:hypothetical protein
MTGDQLAQWRKALVARNRAGRRGRGRPLARRGLRAADGPGRIRIPAPLPAPAAAEDHDGTGEEGGSL